MSDATEPPIPDLASLARFLYPGTFDTLWYWVLTVVIWSVTCHWTLGVPHDLIVRADRGSAEAARAVDAIAEGQAIRLCAFAPAAPWLVGLAGFGLASLATLGFGFGSSFARGLALQAAPLALVAALNARLAIAVRRAPLHGGPLRAALSGRRFWNQVIGLSSILAAATIGAYEIVAPSPWLR